MIRAIKCKIRVRIIFFIISSFYFIYSMAAHTIFHIDLLSYSVRTAHSKKPDIELLSLALFLTYSRFHHNGVRHTAEIKSTFYFFTEFQPNTETQISHSIYTHSQSKDKLNDKCLALITLFNLENHFISQFFCHKISVDKESRCE